LQDHGKFCNRRMTEQSLQTASAQYELGSGIYHQLAQWREDVWRYDYFAVMRRLESCQSEAPRWGKAALPKAEGIRIAHEPSLSFAPAGLSQIEDANSKRPAILRQRFFGYIGPNGPLPVHISDFIRERVLHHNDSTWLAFLDTFAHRFALHFYRAWAQAQPAVSLDRPHDDSFRRFVGSLIGIGGKERQLRDEINDDAKLHFSGWLSRQVRSKDSVESVLGGYFQVPVTLEQWVGHWMPLAQDELTRLGSGITRGYALGLGFALGQGTVIGRCVWDRQHRVRLHIGPLQLAQYQTFLPGGSAYGALSRWMAHLLGHEYEWDARLCLRDREVPQAGFQGHSRLGWTSWLGGRPRGKHAQDVLIRN
jgi:type VI secretion system protein ImpH